MLAALLASYAGNVGDAASAFYKFGLPAALTAAPGPTSCRASGGP